MGESITKESIIAKALQCIDEIYPMSDDTYNDAFFPVEKFYEEAIRWAVDNAPSRILGEGTTLPTIGINKEGMFNDVVVLDISQYSFGRLLRFMLKGWKTKPLIIYDTDARYAQMANPVLRGKPSHPIVAICDNKTRLEAYSMPATAEEIEVASATYMPYDAEYFTIDMADIAAWRLAELVFLSISDANSATICASHLQELVQ